MKKILGLDLGTNSIGWAIINADEITREDSSTFLKPQSISAAGSRIIPMSQDVLGKFGMGNSISQTAERTRLRMARRMYERRTLRRERMLRVLKVLGFLPKHFANQITSYGKFVDSSEPKIAWYKNEMGEMKFLFQNSFDEMVEEFKQFHPELKAIPYDWTIYYLRKKALTQPITKEELSWILLQFNQKRGYYQLRDEDTDDNPNETIEIIKAKILSVEKKEKDKKRDDKYWYEMNLDNGMVYRASFYNDMTNWAGQTKEFVMKTTIKKDGSTKTELSFLPSIDEIEKMDEQRKAKMYSKIKLRTEKDIENSNKTIGCYIYDSLLCNPNQKIIGKLVRTVERKFYKDELTRILNVQKECIPELRNNAFYTKCIELLYPNNEAHRNNISRTDFTNLFINDILFYHRPLKRQKSNIDNCPYEFHLDKERNVRPIKCIAKSNPAFQEFRLWQFVLNLRLYKKIDNVSGKLRTDIDVTKDFLSTEEGYVTLFEWLNDRDTIKQETLLKRIFHNKKGIDIHLYRWNYIEDKEYPCNETRAAILKGLTKCSIDRSFLTHETEKQLWHILYSVEDKSELIKALQKYANKGENVNVIRDANVFAEILSNIKKFKKEYGSYSEKAIRKLLALMRMGKYWSEENIDINTKERIEKIISGECDENIANRVREKAINLTEIKNFKGLPAWLACYIVYNRHSEANVIEKWDKPEDIDLYLHTFKQHSLRNPIVEQVVLETLRTVRDIWKQEGSIDEIHVELGREMKNPADKRRKMTERILQNESTNLRIKAMLMEFANPELGIENVRPYSPSQQDILKIYEENALDNLSKEDPEYDFVKKMAKMAQPSKSDIIRYKCWLEQKYKSPYTGKTIPLTKLFTSAYEIEHIIPQSLYFDDSFSNKVICESEVNKLKDRQLAYQFITKHGGNNVQLNQGGSVTILSKDGYEKLIKDCFSNNIPKMRNLLLEDIPDNFNNRQLNDSRYISKVVMGLLSNIVREKQGNGEYEKEAVSKNVILCNGTITDRLKKDWGMSDVWNKIVLPRFERMNDITKKECFTTINKEGHKIPNMPLELQKGFNKKRIDHRHHAMDAIVIACCTRGHINLLSNEVSKPQHQEMKYALSRKLRQSEKAVINGKECNVYKEFVKPWSSFTNDAMQVLQNIIVSFKQNLRVINKTTNVYTHFDDNGKKQPCKQIHGDSWAIRKSMHKDTVFGEINLRKTKTVSLNDALNNIESIVNKDFKKKAKELLLKGCDAISIKKYIEENKDVWSDIDTSKIEVYYFTMDAKKQNGEPKERYFATRKPLDATFNDKKIKDSVADTGIQKILSAHLANKNGNPEQAFSPDGIEEMNRNIISLNNGKFHQPINKVRVYEKADKFAVGQTGNKSKKFVEAAKGTNLFFAIFEKTSENNDESKKDTIRTYLTIPLNIMIECQKKYGANWNDKIEGFLKNYGFITQDEKLLFILSPNDLVCIPSTDNNTNIIDTIEGKRIYKFVSSSGSQAFFVPATVATPIWNENEFSKLNKMEKTVYNEMIKSVCIKIEVDRLGNITKFYH